MSSQKTTDPYAGMRTRRHWKREDAVKALAACAESGASLTAFARKHQLGLHRLQWWRAQLAQSPGAESDTVRLLPVVPRQAPLITIGAGPSSAVSVTVGAARIDVSDTLHTDPRWLAKLIAELQGTRP